MLRAEVEQIRQGRLDIEFLKESLFRELAHYDWEGNPDNKGEADHSVMIDSLGTVESAQTLFELPGVDEATLLSAIDGELRNVLEELGLPGTLVCIVRTNSDAPPTLDIDYQFGQDAIPILEEKGIKIGTPPRFEEIIAMLNECGHAALARSLYDTLWKGRDDN